MLIRNRLPHFARQTRFLHGGKRRPEGAVSCAIALKKGSRVPYSKRRTSFDVLRVGRTAVRLSDLYWPSTGCNYVGRGGKHLQRLRLKKERYAES